jgi:hypothetical protein
VQLRCSKGYGIKRLPDLCDSVLGVLLKLLQGTGLTIAMNHGICSSCGGSAIAGTL